MYNQTINLPPFKPVASVPSKILNYGFGISILFSVIAVLGILFSILFLISFDENLIFICLLLVLSLVLQVLYLRKTLKHTTTIIDDRGIHYINKFNDKVEKSFLWNDFQKVNEFKGKLKEVNASSDSDLLKYDVFAKMIGSGKYTHDAFFWFVLVNEKVESHKETFSGNHVFSMIYKNRLEMVRTLLLGLAHFRPDISIHPKAFSLYYVNPDSFLIELEKRKEDINNATFITVLIVIAVMFTMLFIFL